MHVTVNHAPLYAYTGGQPLRADRPTVVFIHGVLNDHSVWLLQARYLAHHGWNVLAIDLPGHGRSAGDAPGSVAQAADAVCALLDLAGIARAALVGHSWGSLIALQVAAQLQARASHLVLMGTACPMRVSPKLLAWSQTEPERALALINALSVSTPAAQRPGTRVYDAALARNRRVWASNPAVNLLQRGLLACDSYNDAPAAMARVVCPVCMVRGTLDRMTPPHAAQPLLDAAQAHGKSIRVVDLPVGHHQPTEAAAATLAALLGFLQP
jgi:pimeloyl-ACP methyl ester carboxylesterase